MPKALISRMWTSLTMALLFAVMGFSYSTATPRPDAGARALDAACTPPPLTPITGLDSDTLPTCADLGVVVVNCPFTRSLNYRDGVPPLSSSFLGLQPPNSILNGTVQGDNSIQISGTFQAPTPDQDFDGGSAPPIVNDPALAGSDIRSVGEKPILFVLEVDDEDATTLPVVTTYCLTLRAVDEDGLRTEDLTTVDTPGFITPIGFPDSDDGIDNDFPTALQNQRYEYQLHGNGIVSDGGKLDAAMSGDDPQDPPGIDYEPAGDPDDYSRLGVVQADQTAVYAGTGGSYIVNILDQNANGILDLEITSTGTTDDALGTQIFYDVEEGVATKNIAVGSLGFRIILTEDALDNVMVNGDSWEFFLEPYVKPVYAWELDEDSELPDGLTISEDGLLSGRPQRIGDFAFELIITDTENPFEPPVTQLFYIRVSPAPVSSDFVLTGGTIKVNFGAKKPLADSMKLTAFIAKGLIRDEDDLNGASFDLEIGDTANSWTLSSHVTANGGPHAPLDFRSGFVKHPAKLVPGDVIGLHKDDAKVLVSPTGPNNGLLKISISNINIKDALEASLLASATASPGRPGVPRPEIPLRLLISGGPAGLNLQLNEIVTVDWKQNAKVGRGTIVKGVYGGTLAIGQFMIHKASGSTGFNPGTASSTLDLRLDGFIRDPLYRPLVPGTSGGAAGDPDVGVDPSRFEIDILLGAQCGLQVTGDDPSVRIRGGNFTMVNKDISIPIEKFTINAKKGTFSIWTRAPATDAGLIVGDPASGYVIQTSTEPFPLTVRMRVFDNGGTFTGNTGDDILIFDGQFTVQLFRNGNSIGTR